MSYEIPIPKPSDYGISETNGFLPNEMPLCKLSDTYYDPWESIANNLPSLLLSKNIRNVVNKLPILKVKKELVNCLRQLRRAYSVLTFITNGYIWGIDEPCDTLPDSIAIPLLEISDILGLPPLSTYSSLVLWNYKPIISNEECEVNELDLSNITTINTFTGSMDESWFYLVSVIFERIGSRSINIGLKSIAAVRKHDINTVIECLEFLAENIDELGSILMKMEEMCDPHIFYYRLRPYLAGWKGMSDLGIPNGIKYGEKGDYKIFAGGSNAQSSLIQFLDILLGIEHFSIGTKRSAIKGQISPETSKNSFINDMRNYMPKEHREFLIHFGKVSNIREFVLRNKCDKLTLAYDACLSMLKSFRDKHIQIVTRYIILQATKTNISSTKKFGLSKTHGKHEQKGTGGTALIPFLKQCRDETGSIAASEWGQKVLNKAVLDVREDSSFCKILKRESKYNENNPIKRLKVGLAGDWDSGENDQEETTKIPGHW